MQPEAPRARCPVRRMVLPLIVTTASRGPHGITTTRCVSPPYRSKTISRRSYIPPNSISADIQYDVVQTFSRMNVVRFSHGPSWIWPLPGAFIGIGLRGRCVRDSFSGAAG